MRIDSAQDIGRVVRQKRKADGVTLEDAACLCQVSYAFLSALENGKETVRLDKLLQVLHCLGIEIELRPRGWETGGDET